jgi:hypothetical protein
MTIENDLWAREKCRRKVLNTLRRSHHAQPSFDRIYRSLGWLKRLENLDAAHPIGPAAHMTAKQVYEVVPATIDGCVRRQDIPEPWLTRWDSVGKPFTMCGKYPYYHDFENFLQMWELETNLETAESHARKPHF